MDGQKLTFKEKFAKMTEKLKAFAEAHKEAWQMLKFIMVSLAAGLTEIITFSILQASLKKVNGSLSWWIFKHGTEAGGVGAFVAFLVSTSIAQVVSFIVNSKKTFNANNNLAFAVTAYFVMVIGLILLQTFLTPLITDGINAGVKNLTLSQFMTKIILMLLAFVVVFLCSKFVIMREVKAKDNEGA
jgi:putative flippase GtrA